MNEHTFAFPYGNFPIFPVMDAIVKIKVSLILLDKLLLLPNFFSKSSMIFGFGHGEKDKAHKYLSFLSKWSSLSK